MEDMRLLMCSSFIRSVLICSLKTPMRPSRLSFKRSSRPASPRSAAICSSRAESEAISASYSPLIPAAFSFTSSRSPAVTASRSLSSSRCERMASISARNRFASYRFRLSRSLKYSFAAADCRSRGPACFSSSDRMSRTRTRFCCSSSSFFWATALRRLNLTMPAASSNSSRRSSGFPLKILSIWPWPMME